MSNTTQSVLGQSARIPTIGLFVGSVEDPYEHGLLRGISDVARSAGAHVICFTSGALRSYHGFEAQRNVLYDLVTPHNVDGLIISGTLSHAVTLDEMAHFCDQYRPLPMVSVALSLPGLSSVTAMRCASS